MAAGFNCNIKFDMNPYGLYLAGQTLAGHVDVHIDEPKVVKGISLKISGFAESRWEEKLTNKTDSTVLYQGREDYIATKIYFFGSDEGNAQELPIGNHTYKFSCGLSEKLPTSYESDYGHVRYTISLIFEYEREFNQTYKIAFTVLNPLDLSLNSLLYKVPSQMEINKNFCCGPCRIGPYSIVASVPQTGYVPGQVVKVCAEMNNSSRDDIIQTKFMLRKIVRYYSQTPKNNIKEDYEILDVKHDKPVVRGDHEFYDVSLRVPPVPPTNTNLCKVIHINYDVYVEAVFKKKESNAGVSIPIIIGSTPILQQNDSELSSRDPGQRDSHASTATGSIMLENSNQINREKVNDLSATTAETSFGSVEKLPIDMPVLAVPSYEESTFGNRRIDEDELHPIGHQLYTPRYPVYNFNLE